MEAVIIEDLFKGNQLEELRHWLDNETPYWDDQTWERSPSGVMKKTCPELNTYHIATIDKARDIFAVHDLLPTFSTLYEFSCNLFFDLSRPSSLVLIGTPFSYFNP